MKALLIFIPIMMIYPNLTLGEELANWNSVLVPSQTHGKEYDFYSQDGQYKAYIDGDNVYFDWDAPIGDQLNVGYLSQTVKADDYRGKHLHISAFVSTRKPDIEKLARKLNEQYEVSAAKRFGDTHESISNSDARDRRIERIEELLRLLEDDVHFGISAYIHTETGIRRQGMTQSPEREHSRWRRLNVELGVPANAKFVTISFWFSGLGRAYVDHFSVAENGLMLEGDSAERRFSRIDNIEIDKLSQFETTATDYAFKSLSFE